MPSESAEGENMSAERLTEGVTPFEQRQVDDAARQARHEAIMRGELKVAGGADDLLGGAQDQAEIQRLQEQLGIQSREMDLFGQERLDREGTLRYYEGSLLAEAPRRSYEPQLIIEATRAYMANYEADIQMADMYRASQIRTQLRDRANIFTIAQNPSEAWRPQLEEWRVIEKKESVSPYRELPGDIFEISLSKEDVEKITALLPHVVVEEANGGSSVVVLKEQMAQLWRTKDGRNILNKRREITRPAIVPKEKLPELAETCDKMSKEVWVRHRFFIASALYHQSAGLVDQVCKLFEDKRYSELSSQEWKALFELGPTYEGERAFGSKIGLAMRIRNLVGIGGGGTQGDEAEARRRIEAELAKRGWKDDFLQDLGLGENELLDKLAPMAARNIYTQGSPYETAEGGRDKEWYEEVRETIRGIMGGDENDTKAADELGERVFYMWGLATHYDGRRVHDETVGWPGTDDRMKLFKTERWREREKKGNHNQGPHATEGKYDELAREFGVYGGEFSISTSFMHWALPQNEGSRELTVGEMKSFYERWWNDGTDMKDLPWDSMRTYAWWYYNLGTYFGGAYGHQNERDLLELITKDLWKRDELMNLNTLQDIMRTVDYAVGAWDITKGEIQEWLKSLPEDKRNRFRGMTASQFSDAVVEPYRRGIRKILLVGAFATPYQNRPLIDAGKEWGIFYPGVSSILGIGKSNMEPKEKNYLREVMESMERALRESGYNVSPEEVKKEVKAFLDEIKVTTQ